MTTRVGQRRTRIEVFRTSSDSTDADGWPAGNDDVVWRGWARVEPLKGREFFEAQQVNADITHRVTVPYSAGASQIKPSDRVEIVSTGQALEITGPPRNVDMMNREFEFNCKQAA